MPNTSAPLFGGEIKTVDQMVREIQSTLRSGALYYEVSFGIFKSKTGTEDHHAQIAFTGKEGGYTRKTVNASSFTDMMQQTIEIVNQLKKA